MGRVERLTAAVSDVAVAALSARSGPEAMRAVSDALVPAIGADGVVYAEFTAEGTSRTHAISPSCAWDTIPVHTAWTPVVRRMHPLVDHICRHRPEGPIALSDVMSDLQWSRLEMAALVRPAWGRSRQLRAGVGQPDGVFRGWTFSRDGRDYSDQDRDVLMALRPVLEAVVAHYRASSGTAVSVLDLTPRETAVLRFLAAGLTAPAIARQLAISPRTVQKHLERCYRKLDVRDKVSAVRVATDAGILAAPVQTMVDPDDQLF